MESRKWDWWTYLRGRNRDADVEDGVVDAVGEEEGGKRVVLTDTAPRVNSWWKVAAWHQELSLLLCDDLERWDGGSRREAQEGGDVWTLWLMDMNQYHIVKQLSSN